MKVGEIFAGGGYTTQLIALAVGPDGKVYAQNPVFPPERKQIADAFAARLKNPQLKNVVAISKSYDTDDLFGAPDGSLDAVVTNMNYHDLVLFKTDMDKVNAAVFKALKPGGEYCIIDHSAKAGSGLNDLKLHRIDENLVIGQVTKAGFKLSAASSALRHPEDDRTWITNPQGSGARRGTSDRFMLKFVKP
jgi:predicted methyltransferase